MDLVASILSPLVVFDIYWIPPIMWTGQWGNSLSNTDNGGYFAGDDEWLYYRNNGDGGKLYRMRYDGAENTKLTDQGVDYISVIGEWIFYRQNNRVLFHYTTTTRTKARDSEIRVHRVRNDGKFNRVISRRSLSRFLVRDKIFYQGMQGFGDGIFQMDLSGKNCRLILPMDEIKGGYYFDEEYLYYVSRYGETAIRKKSLNNENENIKIVDVKHGG